MATQKPKKVAVVSKINKIVGNAQTRAKKAAEKKAPRAPINGVNSAKKVKAVPEPVVEQVHEPAPKKIAKAKWYGNHRHNYSIVGKE